MVQTCWPNSTKQNKHLSMIFFVPQHLQQFTSRNHLPNGIRSVWKYSPRLKLLEVKWNHCGQMWTNWTKNRLTSLVLTIAAKLPDHHQNGFSLTHQSSRVESRRVESRRVESSFPTLKSKGAKLHLSGFFELSMYWYLQTVLQRSIYLERTSRAILHRKLGDVKNFLVYIIASYCEVVL